MVELATHSLTSFHETTLTPASPIGSPTAEHRYGRPGEGMKAAADAAGALTGGTALDADVAPAATRQDGS